ncbi:Gag-Pol fusion protein [Plakobranchus ocellatus]|uniref:Gag-Pol fusion protein n=1 Tax=Plakobranchus ocellatus TaxID=259542 RepID=A0AAV3YGS8_9GAST|nr:Gag-Pol fusion protein [Plakobranchus ocellatus]
MIFSNPECPVFKKGPEQLHPVEIPPYPWSLIGVDICTILTSIEGCSCMVVAVDYPSKWTEAEALRRKSVEGVTCFLYNCICRHRCIDIQIKDRCRDFVNGISTELHRPTGVKQKVIIPCYFQVNGQVEQSSRTI